MRRLSKLVAVATVLFIASPSYANNLGYANTLTANQQIIPGSIIANQANLKTWKYSPDGPSETAFFFHRRGVKMYEKDRLDKAEIAFKASLRAQGNNLRGQTFLYLAHIAKENQEIEKANNYAREYFKLETANKKN